uniref:Uncharacterized protein n=1 Tax=Meloidogyne enterolobii TaxID=390850 RepID=A0A6V7W6N4_MELEN|nr:unnamed protein product [Meloidogyne enterolobii]
MKLTIFSFQFLKIFLLYLLPLILQLLLFHLMIQVGFLRPVEFVASDQLMILLIYQLLQLLYLNFLL